MHLVDMGSEKLKKMNKYKNMCMKSGYSACPLFILFVTERILRCILLVDDT